MRTAIALAILAGAFLIAPKPAPAGPLALGDQAKLSQDLRGAPRLLGALQDRADPQL